MTLPELLNLATRFTHATGKRAELAVAISPEQVMPMLHEMHELQTEKDAGGRQVFRIAGMSIYVQPIGRPTVLLESRALMAQYLDGRIDRSKIMQGKVIFI